MKRCSPAIVESETTAAGHATSPASTTRNESVAPPRARNLKVMHVINSMAVGGTENGVLNLATRLVDGFEHHLCCIRNYDAELVHRFQLQQVTALNLRHSRLSCFVPQLVTAIRSYRPDIVHSRNWGAIESVFAARLARIPVVIHSEHGYEIDVLSKTPLRQRWTRRLACAAADAFFTVSRDLRDFHAAQAGIPVERIQVLYNGVDSHHFAPNQGLRMKMRDEHRIAPEDFVVGAVGRAVAIKDYKTVIRALGALSRKRVPFKLLLAGDGPELPGLVALAESVPGVGPNFLALGRRSDVPELLAGMDVFVQTSLREGMSNTLLEAMSTGLPAVVTSVGGNPEIVENGRTGWLFRPGDVEHLSNLLMKLAADRNLGAEVGRAARLQVEKMFSQQRMLESYRELYSELAGKRHVVRGWPQAGFTINEERA